MTAPRLAIKRHRTTPARRLAGRRVADELLLGLPAVTAEDDGAELTRELEQMRRIVATLGQLPGAAWPPAPRARTATGAQRPSRLRVTPGVAAALACATLAITFLAGSLTHPLAGPGRPTAAATDHRTPHVVLAPLPSSGVVNGRAVAYMTGGAHMTLTLKGLPPSAPGTYYELWLMTSYTRLVPVTSFRVGVSGDGTLRLLLPDDPHAYRFLDISVQRLGGGSAISHRSVLRGGIPA